MTRNGKMARLPDGVRNELNVRLEKGEEGAPLLHWLNALPDVQEMLQENFGGAALTKQNLSEWRLGGFREWQIRQEWLAQARQLSDAEDEMVGCVDVPLLPGALAGALAARYAALLNGWDGEPDSKFEEKVRLLRGLNRDIALLQKTMQQASRHRIELERVREEREERELEKEKERLVAPFKAQWQSDALAATMNDGERGRLYAEFIAAVDNQVPPPADWDARAEAWRDQRAELRRARAAQSNPVAPSPGESNPPVSRPTESNPVALVSPAASDADAGPEMTNGGD
jgi:hypothetical protein